MEDKIIKWAEELQSLAQAGLFYGHDNYDKERYQRIRDISAEMMAGKSGLPLEQVKNLFCSDSGYQTPKIDTRAAVFKDGKILLVHENNGTWSLPGGWCDYDQSISSNTIKEVLEETGLSVSAEKLIAIQDWRRHNVTNYAFGVMKAFVLCKILGGEFHKNIETSEVGYFSPDYIPENLAVEKTTKDQIQMCFDAYSSESWNTLFE